ncbi:MAG: sigma-70 family RNA polymerase sigma factor [Actinobacteria bacterium]|nr:sigma-70 family RNA polymerase sigma factor [Actinomycetota bacterium]
MDAFERLSDEELLAATRRQPEAFAAFYRRHEKAMLVFFLRRCAGAEVAADLTAEVFTAALGSARRFRPGAAPAVAWLYGIARNKLASSRSRGRVEERARRRLGAEPLVLTDGAIERVEALADAERAAEVLAELLRQLPPEQRQALRSHIVEERDYEEVAGDLECSQAVVRQRVSRGLRTLRARFEEGSA